MVSTIRTLHRHAAATMAVAAVLILVSGTSAPAAAESQIGAASLVVNTVIGTLPSTRQPSPLRAGIDVFQNETISTAETSASQVLFQDKTELSIGPVSEVVLDRFVFDPDPSRSQVAVSIAKGVARTPAASIGIRGTLLTITVSENKTTTVSVEVGSAFVTAQGRTVPVDAGFSTLVRLGMAPTQPVASPPLPVIATQMLALLEAEAVRQRRGTGVGARGTAAEMPQVGGNLMLSPNIDPQKQSEIRGHKKAGDP